MTSKDERASSQEGRYDTSDVLSGATRAVLGDADRKRILYEWNATQTHYPELCVHQLFEQQAARSCDAVALVCRGQRLTYRELNQRANQVARFLRKNGVGPDTLVGVCLERSPELVIALLGVWKAGGAYVPLDPAYPPERLTFMIGDAAVRMLLTERKCKQLFKAADARTVCLDDDWPEIGQESTGDPCFEVSPSSLAYVMYTSGSTGQPKGAMIVHAGLLNYLCWAIETYQVTPGGSVPVHSSIAFDLTVTSLYPALLAGGQVELLSEGVGAQNLLAALRENRNRCLVKITPAHLDVLTQQLRPEELAGLTKAFIIGGENLPAESLSLWRDLARNSRLINEYGPTETVVGCCVHEVKPSDPRNGPVPIGRPIANTQLYVLDEDQQPVPIGTMGELYVGGAGVARGYLNRPELTQERFLPDPFSGRVGARLYRTGDLARYRPDGTLEFLGRVDNQVKVRGYRIELGEIEAILASHPGVQSCAVLAREDTPGNKQLVGYVVARGSQSPATEDVQTFLKRQLPEYMVPAYVVHLESLPLTANGKVDRKALPAPSGAGVLPLRKFTAPRNETEQSIATLWAELLKVEGIGIDDDFFELGGHSLLAIRVVARMRDLLGVELSPQTLFENSTLAALAALVTEAKGETKNPQSISPRGVDRPCAVSFAQEQLWLLDQLLTDSPAYNIVDVVPIRGNYNGQALKGALMELVRRHEILRTAFSRPEGQLRQTVTSPFEVELAEFNLSPFSEEERQREWTRIVRDQGRKPFDLSQIPLFRTSVVHASPTEHRLLLTVHHIIADEWSMELIQKELGELYAAFSQGRPSALEPLPVQYADFACWQRESLQVEVLQGQIEYWKSELKSAVHVLALPTDKPRPTTPTLRGTTESFALPKELLAQLLNLGRQEQTTLFMTLEAAFAALLHRYTGQDDILVGTPISGRTHTETQRMIGCFLNTVVLRAQFHDDLSFRALLRRARDRALGAYANADLPFQWLVAEMALDRDPGRTPLFQAMFILHSRDGLSQVSKVSSNHDLETGTSKFDLTLSMSETEGGLAGSIEYSTDLFQAETIRRLNRSFAQLLAEIARDPDQRISRVPMLADADRQQLVLGWNSTAQEFADGGLCLHQLFARQAARTPDRVALVFDGQILTYGDLDQRSEKLAQHLITLGVRPDMLVGLLFERSLEMVVGLLGILKAGGAYVPLDPSFPPERLAYVIEDARMQVLVTHQGLDGMLRNRPSTIVHLDREWAEIGKSIADSPIRSDVNPEHLAYVLYTSGSTGMPKGVAIPHSAIANFLLSMQREPGITAKDTLLAVTTLSFDIAGLELYLPLVSGAKVVIASREDVVDPHRLIAMLHDEACTFLQATPATWRALIDAGWKGSLNLKALCGGEAMSRELAQALLPRCAELWNMYGPTETTVWSTLHKMTAAEAQPPIGRPIANTQVYVLDAHLDLVPPGAVGELYIGGKGLARGYLNREELTRERFVPNPFEPGTRLYRTGDLARFCVDGRLECLGRTDHQVKIRGYRIELGEIESCMARHPNVRQVVVVAREDVAGDKRLVAYVVPSDPPADFVDHLRALLRAAVPEYMVPAHFVSLDAFPLTPNGKVDRKALPAPALDVAPSASQRTAAGNEVEAKVIEVLGRHLNVINLGVEDSFFERGGHSLMAVRVISELGESFGVRLSVRAIFENPTAAGLARIVQRTKSAAAKSSHPSRAERESVIHKGLSPLRKRDGSGLPLLLIHGDLANEMLQPYLPEGQAMWGYLHQGSDGERIRLTTVEALAERCHQELLEEVGRGPCVIAGHSFGGLVAYHVGVLRQREGLTTPRLILLDTVHPFANSADQVGWGPRALLARYRSLRVRLEDHMVCSQAIEILDRGGVVPIENRRAYVLASYARAGRRYQPPIWNGDLEVIRASDGFLRSDLWERSAKGSIRRMVISGDHLSIVRTKKGFAPIGVRIAEILAEVYATLHSTERPSDTQTGSQSFKPILGSRN